MKNNDFLISHEPFIRIFSHKKWKWKTKIQMIAAEIFNVIACNIKPQWRHIHSYLPLPLLMFSYVSQQWATRQFSSLQSIIILNNTSKISFLLLIPLMLSFSSLLFTFFPLLLSLCLWVSYLTFRNSYLFNNLQLWHNDCAIKKNGNDERDLYVGCVPFRTFSHVWMNVLFSVWIATAFHGPWHLIL